MNRFARYRRSRVRARTGRSDIGTRTAPPAGGRTFVRVRGDASPRDGARVGFAEFEGKELCRFARILSATGAADALRRAMRRRATDLLRM